MAIMARAPVCETNTAWNEKNIGEDTRIVPPPLEYE